MSLGHYDYEQRYRRRFFNGSVKLGLLATLLLGIGLFAYQMGVEQMKGRDTSLREEVSLLSRQKAELELLASQMQHAAKVAEARTAEVEARLKRDVPTGELARLSKLAGERLAAGMDAARLAFVIEHAQTPRNCQPPDSKKLVLATPLLKAGNRSATFGNGAITVTGEGMSARNTQGQPESWFDPAQPVKIRIISQSGKEVVASGALPLHQSVVVDNIEHRFTFTPGPRSFIEVTADRCPFP